MVEKPGDYGLWETNKALEGVVVGWVSLVLGIKEGTIAWSTGHYKQTMNHGTLHQKLMTYCMVTNITLRKKH